VDGVSAGDEVVLNPGLACGTCEYCRRGEQSECASFGLIGLSRPGTFAEKVVVPARCLGPKPEHLSFEEAAAFPLAHVTAWRMLMTRAALVPGETVLIHGIGGGVAIAALQIAKVMQARTIVTSSSDEKLKRAKKLGAHETINYRKTDDVAQKVKKLTGGRGVDISFDAVGAATVPVDVAAVRRGGRIVICGVTTGAEANVNLQAVYWNQISLIGSTMGSDEDFRNLVNTVTSSKLKPVVDSVHPLDDAQKALRRMADGKQFGKIVLKVSG
jgi:NADPH:quinone reductase-like Zn-dependent oxidoreductase